MCCKSRLLKRSPRIRAVSAFSPVGGGIVASFRVRHSQRLLAASAKPDHSCPRA
jgi:hypothetical protein